MSSFQHPPAAHPPTPPGVVASAADILSYIPHALGFLPDESLVVITLAGRRLGATLRVDLPAETADPSVFARGILSFLEGDHEADGTLVVVYTKQSWQRLTVPPRNALVLTVQGVLAAAGLPTRGGWLVSASGWRDYFCVDEGCCAWPGQPLDSVSYSPLSAELVYGGSSFDASAAAAVRRAAPAVGLRSTGRRTVLREVEDAQADVAARCAGRWCSCMQFRATAAVWEAVLLHPEELDPARDPGLVGFLLASLESRTVRDFLLASTCLGPDRALDGAAACGLLEQAHPGRRGCGDGAAPDGGDGGTQLRQGPGAEAVLPAVGSPGPVRDGVLATRLLLVQPGWSAGSPDPGPRPDAAADYADLLAGRYVGSVAWGRVDAMSVVLAQLTAVSDGEARAAALTMSGWFEYARGRGSRASVYLDAAEREVPGYRLARLLQELLHRGGLPAWARCRATAWTSSSVPVRDGAV